MEKKRSIFGLIWCFIVSQIITLIIVESCFIFLPIPITNALSIFLISFILGLLLFCKVKKYFTPINFSVGIISIVIFSLCFLAIPILGKIFGDKANLQSGNKGSIKLQGLKELYTNP